MSVHTEIDKKTKLIVHKVKGALTFNEFKQAFDELLQHPNFNADMDGLWDIRNGTLAKMSSLDFIKITNYIHQKKERGSNYREALVTSGDLDFGLSKIYEAYGNDIPNQINVFRNIEDAYSWLGRNGCY